MKSLLLVLAICSVSLTILVKTSHSVRVASDDTTVTPDFGFGGDDDSYDDGLDCDDDDFMVAFS